MQSKTQPVGKIILLCVFLISLSLFSYQVTLTRLYSAILFYHYVFLTTSFAILGVGIGSVIAYRNRVKLMRAIEVDPLRPNSLMMLVKKLTFALSCGFICVFFLIYIQPYIDQLFVFITLGLIPFVISGYLFSTLYCVWSKVSGKLYFADLVGAGAGSILIILLLDHLGMFRTIILICLLPLIVAAVLPCNSKKVRAFQYIAPIILAAVIFLPSHTVSKIETNFHALLSNNGKTYGDMQKSGLDPDIVFSRWDSFARTDLIKLGTIPQLKILTIDGTANAPMYEFDGNADDLDHIKPNTGFVPFAMAECNDALIIGAGGGRGVLYALGAGSKNIAAVEINPASIEAVRMFGEFNGFLYERPEVRVFEQDGRNFARTTNERFDMIFLSLVVTNTSQGVGFALSENYVHTVEAMEDYLHILSSNGRIAFVTHDQTSLLRLASTAVQALVNKGIPLVDTPDHIAMFSQITDDGEDNVQMIAPVIVIKNHPFSEEDSRILEQEVFSRNHSPLHIPHRFEWDSFEQIKDGQLSFSEFIRSYDERVGPVTDKSPYFFHFEKGIPSVLLIILILSFSGALVLAATQFRKKENLRTSVYFGLLGMGFMMIQIPLIQMFILYLGHPTLAFSYILASMLIGCGIGGFLNSRRVFRKTIGIIYPPPVILALICLAVLFSLQLIFQSTAGFSSIAKVLVASVVVAIPSFFIGMPFPRGMALLGHVSRNDVVPIMWGINGITSVTGSVLSIILSMTFGFDIALLAGIVIYVGVGFFKKV